jgi:hypothetical protein
VPRACPSVWSSPAQEDLAELANRCGVEVGDRDRDALDDSEEGVEQAEADEEELEQHHP